jgi:GNAT superfamily N-acetyltransferase
MYVMPAYRGAGIAGKILEELEQRTRDRGVRAVRPDTNARLTEANRMYREAGYSRIEDYNSNPRADRWYEKLLA